MTTLYYKTGGVLKHHGIKGQKWGIRRFRNKDGSLTPLGRKRYSQDDWSDDAKQASELRKKSVSQMSNAELRKMNERTRLENEYSNLNPSKVKKGMKFVAGAAVATTTVLTLYNNSGKMVKAGKDITDKTIDIIGDMVIKDLNKGLAKPWY